MKKHLYAMDKTISKLTGILLILSVSLFLPFDTLSQGKEKNGPPSWAPAHGYRAKTRHVYFPEHNVYYDLKKEVYIYKEGSSWQIGVKLPSIYANVNLSKSSKVELELNTDSPQQYNTDHLEKYHGHEMEYNDDEDWDDGGKMDKGQNKEKNNKGKKKKK